MLLYPVLGQEQDTASIIDIVDDNTDFNHLDQKKYMRIVERNMKKELLESYNQWHNI